MKKILVPVICTLLFLQSTAEEGMWLPMLLGETVYADMVKKGLKLTREQLYSINKSSLKDAILIIDGVSTGVMVSDQGLVFTNYRGGKRGIAAVGTPESNFLQNGFYALNKSQEIKIGFTVQFLDRIIDVTNEVEAAFKGFDWRDRVKKTSEVYKAITDKVTDKENGLTGTVYSMFKGNQFFLYVYKTYRDIRLVGIPPEKAVEFGNNTGSWDWPTYTGAFSVFRIYSSSDGKPADYNMNNIPLKPKHFLPISIKGIKNGDFAMVYGYPAITNRYETSYGLKLRNEIESPLLLDLWDIRLKLLSEQMNKDTGVKLKLAGDFERIASNRKYLEGETKQLLKLGTIDQKQNRESDFILWSKGKPSYEYLMGDYSKIYKAWIPYCKNRLYISEGILGSPLATFSSSLVVLEANMVKTGVSPAEIKRSVAAANEARKIFLQVEDKAMDEKLITVIVRKFFNDIDKNQHPIGFYEGLKAGFGDLKEEATFKKWARNVFSKTMILDDAKWASFIAKPDAITLQSDPAFAFASAFVKGYNTKYAPLHTLFSNTNDELGKTYLKGIMEMNPVATKRMYPDANFSMRVSYGSVQSYSPKDGIQYDFVSTASGIIEKYKPGDHEFDLPLKQIELMKKKEFGQYIDKRKNDLVVNFITTNDNTGGNEGSPVIDASGNLIGLIAGSNYEALSHKIAYDMSLNRTICVDVRYVLWCIEKSGGASNIISELKLAKN